MLELIKETGMKKPSSFTNWRTLCISCLVHQRPADGVSHPRLVSVTSSVSMLTGMGRKGAGSDIEKTYCYLCRKIICGGEETGCLVGLGASFVIGVFCLHSVSRNHHS